MAEASDGTIMGYGTLNLLRGGVDGNRRATTKKKFSHGQGRGAWRGLARARNGSDSGTRVPPAWPGRLLYDLPGGGV